VDVGLLYWRTDLLPHAPASIDELTAFARRGMLRPNAPPYGIVWQGARYEGLVTVFVEYLGAFGGEIIDHDGRVVVDSPAGVRALTYMRDQIYRDRITPLDVLTWHEEESRFAFQNGNSVLMRNWPYCYALLADSTQSRVAGNVGIAPMPGAPGGHPTAALGGYQLAINAYTEHPDAAYALISYLTAPEQMLERARLNGQYPTRPALYSDPRLAKVLSVPLDQVRHAIESAVPRPVIPIYTQLSEFLQVQLHRALTRQTTPEEALHAAARDMSALIERTRVREIARQGHRGG
jgi:multiple sugar transport system substrate-binding protein